MTKYFHANDGVRTPLKAPKDVKAFLAAPDLHWRDGYSAAELAKRWIGAQDFPPAVRRVLQSCPKYHDARVIEGFFEHQTDLGSPGRPSQTDLLVFARTPDHAFVIGVEGKRDESFGQVVSSWNTTAGKSRRLESLCAQLGLSAADCPSLRYQLLHRTVAILREAEQADLGDALMLVHSFSPGDTSFGEFSTFTELLGVPLEAPDRISESRRFGNIMLRFGWARDPVDLP